MTRTKNSGPVRVNIVALGCPKNLVDTEVIAGQLLSEGMQIVSDPTDAHAVIINTCAFIDAAKVESIDAILQIAAARDKTRPAQALIVAGCLPQRFREALPKAMPEVDAFMGIDQIATAGAIVRAAVERRHAKISNLKFVVRNRSKVRDLKSKSAVATEACGRTVLAGQRKHPAENLPPVEVSVCPTYILSHTTPRLRLTPRHYAYVKIADGCDNRCSYCTIPLIRGGYRSRPLADVIAEAKALLADGVKELNLISQDTTYYGHDIAARSACGEKCELSLARRQANTTTICKLLRALDSLPGDFWIRLLYTHPAHWTDELIRTVAECRKVVRYVDLPLQHINDTLLDRMRRRVSRQQIVELISRIRRCIPGVAIRTSFIVGFPGETKEQFAELVGFVRAMRFERLGVFTYSREEGTPAAKLPGHLAARVKRARAAQLMRVQRTISRGVLESYTGRVIKVLVEGRRSAKFDRDVIDWEHGLARQLRGHVSKPDASELFVARSEADAPEIDGVVFVHSPKKTLSVGEFVWVKVTGHTDYDLIAEPV